MLRSRAVLLNGGVEDLNGYLGQSLHVLLLAYYLRLELVLVLIGRGFYALGCAGCDEQFFGGLALAQRYGTF
jgi:hypothetical protein